MSETIAPVQAGFWDEMVTVNGGETLAHLSDRQPVMLVFLRHFGCSFCREALFDISNSRQALESKGLRIVLVHMAAQLDVAERFFHRYKLLPIDHIADPDLRFYEAFGLKRTSPAQLIGLMNWIRGFQAGVVEGHGFSHHSDELGDGFQMPGVFILHQGRILCSFRHEVPYDRPDYVNLAGCCEA